MGVGGACCFKLTSGYTVAAQLHPLPSVSTDIPDKAWLWTGIDLHMS